jgi:hypothetical protein
MFLPKSASETSEAAQDEQRKRRVFTKIEGWCKELVPEAIRSNVDISVAEVICGDPKCAPIDTAITISFMNKDGKSGMAGIPAESKDVRPEDLKHSFPTPDILEAWHRGEEKEWPPEPDFGNDEVSPIAFPALRFSEGQRVECRVSQDAWMAGKVMQLWYREPQWPRMSWAPYKILLDDGRNIFAPGDADQIIRLEGSGGEEAAHEAIAA